MNREQLARNLTAGGLTSRQVESLLRAADKQGTVIRFGVKVVRDPRVPSYRITVVVA